MNIISEISFFGALVVIEAALCVAAFTLGILTKRGFILCEDCIHRFQCQEKYMEYCENYKKEKKN